ncbi:MAG: hypothetical protein WDM81_11495 [Rhizomicrobium sp.]
MIPNRPLLAQRRFYAHFSNSYYNKHFLITRNVPPDAGTDDTILGAIKYNLTHVHEWTHWFQHVGTTFGTFLDALRASQKSTLISWLREMPRDTRRTLVENRLNRGQPFINFHADSEYLQFDSGDEKTSAGVLKQIWFDHQWAHAMFEDSRLTDRLGNLAPEPCSAVMADVILNLCNSAGFISRSYDTNGHQGAREWYFADDDKFVEIYANLGSSVERITAANLMECSACMNELQILTPGGVTDAVIDREALVRRWFESFLASDYSAPFKAFTASLETRDRVDPAVRRVNAQCANLFRTKSAVTPTRDCPS